MPLNISQGVRVPDALSPPSGPANPHKRDTSIFATSQRQRPVAHSKPICSSALCFAVQPSLLKQSCCRLALA